MNEIKVNTPANIFNLEQPGNEFSKINVGSILKFKINKNDEDFIYQIVYKKNEDRKLLYTHDFRNNKPLLNTEDIWHEISIGNWWERENLNEIKRLQKLAGINEIKINKPNKYTEFPIKINNKEEYNEIISFLNSRGYKWYGGRELDYTPFTLINFPQFISKPTLEKFIQINKNFDYQDTINPINKKI